MSTIKVKPIEWIPATGYDYTDGLPFEYEVWNDGTLRFRRAQIGQYVNVSFSSAEQAKEAAYIHHRREVLKYVEQ